MRNGRLTGVKRPFRTSTTEVVACAAVLLQLAAAG